MSLLTDQEIEGMGAGNNYPGTVPGMQRFARAIEAAELKRLHDYDTRLTAVMPADFKDWRENSEREWPELAAWVITNLREQRDEANAEIERKDALLRGAVLTIEHCMYGCGDSTRTLHQMCNETLAAIKTHSGEV